MSEHPYDHLEMDHAAFKATRNPMHAWAAYAMARVNDVPVPEWVLKYLDGIARGLLQLAHENSKGDGPKDLAPVIQKGMGLKRSALTGYHHSDELIIALNVRVLKKQYGPGGTDAAVADVAKAAGASKGAVWRAWSKYKDHLPDDGALS